MDKDAWKRSGVGDQLSELELSESVSQINVMELRSGRRVHDVHRDDGLPPQAPAPYVPYKDLFEKKRIKSKTKLDPESRRTCESDESLSGDDMDRARKRLRTNNKRLRYAGKNTTLPHIRKHTKALSSMYKVFCKPVRPFKPNRFVSAKLPAIGFSTSPYASISVPSIASSLQHQILSAPSIHTKPGSEMFDKVHDIGVQTTPSIVSLFKLPSTLPLLLPPQQLPPQLLPPQLLPPHLLPPPPRPPTLSPTTISAFHETHARESTEDILYFIAPSISSDEYDESSVRESPNTENHE